MAAKHLLSDRQVRNAKPQARPYRLHDGAGLALRIAPTGSHSWQLRYRHNGKPQTLTLGKLDRLSLAEARDAAEKAAKLADTGEHLTTAKRVERVTKATAIAQTFAKMRAEWAAAGAREKGWSADYIDEVDQCLRNHLADLDPLPIAEIRATVVAPILQRVQLEAPGMAGRTLRRLHAILWYAVEVGAIPSNPLPLRRRAKAKVKHYPAVVDLPGLGAILRAARDRPARAESVNRAHLLLAFTAQRIDNIVNARWQEFDLDAGTWSIPRETMKRKDAERGPHVVPLPPRLLAMLREWRTADGERAVYVCPAKNKRKPIIAERIGVFYRETLELHGRHSPHSWRSAFSTVCRDAGKPGDVVEAQLDHVVGNSVASVYDRAARLDQRRALLTWYEATLIAARDGATVVALDKRRRR